MEKWNYIYPSGDTIDMSDNLKFKSSTQLLKYLEINIKDLVNTICYHFTYNKQQANHTPTHRIQHNSPPQSYVRRKCQKSELIYLWLDFCRKAPEGTLNNKITDNKKIINEFLLNIATKIATDYFDFQIEQRYNYILNQHKETIIVAYNNQ